MIEMTKKGYKQTPEHRANSIRANKGKHHSDETKKLLSEKHKGENNPNYGKHPSEATRKKQSIFMSGENNPNYGKSGMKNHNYGKRGELSSNYGRHLSETTKIKIREIVKNRPYHTKSGNTAHSVTIALISSQLERIGYIVQSWCTTGERFVKINGHSYSPDIYAKNGKDVVLIEVGGCLIHKLFDLMSYYPIVLQVPKIKMELNVTISKSDIIVLGLWQKFIRINSF
jgi:hypothetical protein